MEPGPSRWTGRQCDSNLIAVVELIIACCSRSVRGCRGFPLSAVWLPRHLRDHAAAHPRRLERPDCGEVWVDQANDVAMVFQEPRLLPWT